MVTDYNIPERCICTCPLCVLFVVCPCDDCTIRSVNLYSFLFPFFQLLRSNDMTPANHEHEHPPPCRHCRCSRSRPYAFSKHPDKFIVIVFEKEHVTGGMASPMNIDPKLLWCIIRYGTSTMESRAARLHFANTLRIFRELGHPPQKALICSAPSLPNLHARLFPH
jgi:hypothetical protein